MDRISMRKEAETRFERAWREQCREHPEWTSQSRECPAVSILPRVLEMMEMTPGRRVQTLRPVIHRMLVEAAFIDECGDPVTCPDRGQLLGQAQLLAEVLDEVCREHETSYHDGNVSHMFG